MPVANSEVEGLVAVRALVQAYTSNRAHYRSAAYDELSTRTSFIDRFFEALGWDVTDSGPDREVVFHNRHRVDATVAGPEDWDEELTQEEMDERASHTDVLDYLFQYNPQPLFCVEAKRPHVGINGRGSAYQVKSYCWNQELPFGVLTDFEQLRVFVTTTRPDRANPTAGVLAGFDLAYTDYEVKWHGIWQMLSREAVVRGDAAARARVATPRGAKQVDESFLLDLEAWRLELANDLIRRHPDLHMWELEEVTQRILDRLVFVRVLEDRRVEPNVVLRRFARRTDAYRHLTAEFRRLDVVYNGQLFAPHHSEDLNVSDGVLQRLIASLYTSGGSPYRFDVFSADFLGKVYERFLGTQFVLKDTGAVALTLKPEIRHAGGVYYTPKWVVDHMVAASLGPLLKDRRPEQLTDLKFLDPACGSGTFLLGLLSYLIDWHERYYDANPTVDLENHYTDTRGDRQPTTDFKGQLVTNNIHGVDVDPRAVEVAQMSLYLRILEEETSSTLSAQPRLFEGAHLPTLARNIRSGNSLIDSTMVAGTTDTEEVTRRINPFDWQHLTHGFGPVFQARGGFDVVIGNPPYTRVQVLRGSRPEETRIMEASYVTAGAAFDIATLFIEKGLTLLRPRLARQHGVGGVLTYITTRGFTETDAAEPVRQLLAAGQHIASIIDFHAGRVFPEAGAYTVIMKATHRANPTWRLVRVPDPPSREALAEAIANPLISADVPAAALGSKPWPLALPAEDNLLTKLALLPSLSDITGDAIFQGVITGSDSTFRVADLGPDPDDPANQLVRPASTAADSDPLSMERGLLRPMYAGKTDFQRFAVAPSSEWLLFPYSRVGANDSYKLMPWKRLKEAAPNVAAWLQANEDLLRARSGDWTDSNWYSYSRRQNLERFAAPKIMVPSILNELCAHYDTDAHYFVNVSTGGYGLGHDPRSGTDPEYVAALLNSRLLSWVLTRYSRTWRGGWFEAKKGNLARLPLAVTDAAAQQQTVAYYREVRDAVATAIAHPLDADLARTAATSRTSFDHHVYALYGLSFANQNLVQTA